MQPMQNNQGLHLLSSKSELSLSSVVEMGFTESQAERIYAVVSEFRGSNHKHALSALSALFVLGLNAASVLKVLEKCPELFTVKEAQLQQRITNLRKLGFVEGEMKVSIDTAESLSLLQWYQTCLSGSLQRVVVHYPQILTVPAKRIRNAVAFLRQKCLFTMHQVTGILRDSPAVVMEHTDHLEYKFQVSVQNRRPIRHSQILYRLCLKKELKILILDLMVFRCKQFYGIALFLQFNKSIVLFCYN